MKTTYKTLIFILISIALMAISVSCTSTSGEHIRVGEYLDKTVVDTVFPEYSELYEQIVLTNNSRKSANTWNLREKARFEVKVADGVWWVPTSTLGKTRYSNEQISMFTEASPEFKREMISSLYEAIQLYQVSDFANDNDNQHINKWEQHKPGYYCVLKNCGCCAASSNWLYYILEGDYDEVGLIEFSEEDGGGHVFNYFKQDGYYYFIDMTHYRNDNKKSAIEDGNYESYRNVDPILGNIHKAKNVEDYVKYFISIANEPPVFFAIYKNREVSHLYTNTIGKMNYRTYEAEMKDILNVVYNKEGDFLDFAFETATCKPYDWELSKSHEIKHITRF